MFYFDKFFDAYVQAIGFTAHEYHADDLCNPDALFACSGEFGDSWNVWDEIADIIDVDSLESIAVDALEFYNAMGIDEWEDCEDVERAGYDFHFTRNGHGCGFWDGDWNEPHATELTEFAETFGTMELEGTRDENGELTALYFGE